MKLKRLWIDGFKNLNDFELDFSDKEGITVLIGNNGSGKSNVLEAISIIFIELQKKEYSYQFDYEIEYKINDKNIKIKQHNEELSFYIDEVKTTILQEDKLPYKVIASYNGAVNRLWEIYKDSYFDINRKKITTERNSILYIDLDELDIYKLMSIYSEIYDVYIENDTTEKEILKEKYAELDIAIELRNYDKKLVKNENLVTFLGAISTEDIITFDSLVAYFNSTLPNTKQDFLNYLFNCKFRTLIDEFKNEEQNLLSEGEQHLKLLELVLDILAEQNTLILLDEPDSHIHVGNKKKITELLDKLDDIDNEVILTTHSPSLMHEFQNHLVYLEKGEVKGHEKAKILKEISGDLMSFTEQQIVLNSNSDILLVEGKLDMLFIKEAINKLNGYSELDNIIFIPTGGASGLRLFIDKFTANDNQKIIAILDNDKAGKSEVKEILTDTYQTQLNNNGYVKIEELKNTFLLILPKPDTVTNSQYEIEDFFPVEKMVEISKTQIDTFKVLKDFLIKKDMVKKKLSEKCSNYNSDDFKEFEKLLDLILIIKDL